MPLLDKLILKELDHQRVSAIAYSKIINNLDSVDKKTQFLNYMSKNRNTILSSFEIIQIVKEITK